MKRQSFCLYILTILFSGFLLSACGFSLRGATSSDFKLPFKTLSMNVSTTDLFGATLKRYIESTGTRVVTENIETKKENKSTGAGRITDGTETGKMTEGAETKTVKKPKIADVQLQILENARTREILSLSTAGRVREYALFYTFRFQVKDKNDNVLMDPAEIKLRRTLTYSDSQAYAKEKEAEMLYEDMEKDVIQQLLRRLANVEVDPNESGTKEPGL